MLSIQIHEKFSHFRNLSEIKREAKGGYLKATISVSKGILSPDLNFQLTLDLIPAREEDNNSYSIHPNLLNLMQGKTRNNKNAKNNEPISKLKSPDPHWQVVLRKVGNKLFAMNDEKDEAEFHVDISSALKETRDEFRILCGHDQDGKAAEKCKEQVKKGIRLNIIRADQKNVPKLQDLEKKVKKKKCNLQEKKAEKTTSITSVLRSRLANVLDENNPNFRDLLIGLIKQFYYSGEERVSMHIVKMRVTMNNSPLQYVTESTMIINPNEPLTAPLEIAHFNPIKFCERGNQLINLTMEKEVKHNFLQVIIREKDNPQSDYKCECKIETSGKSGEVAFRFNDHEKFPTNVDFVMYLQREMTGCASLPVNVQFHEHHLENCGCELSRPELIGFANSTNSRKRKSPTLRSPAKLFKQSPPPDPHLETVIVYDSSAAFTTIPSTHSVNGGGTYVEMSSNLNHQYLEAPFSVPTSEPNVPLNSYALPDLSDWFGNPNEDETMEDEKNSPLTQLTNVDLYSVSLPSDLETIDKEKLQELFTNSKDPNLNSAKEEWGNLDMDQMEHDGPFAFHNIRRKRAVAAAGQDTVTLEGPKACEIRGPTFKQKDVNTLKVKKKSSETLVKFSAILCRILKRIEMSQVWFTLFGLVVIFFYFLLMFLKVCFKKT